LPEYFFKKSTKKPSKKDGPNGYVLASTKNVYTKHFKRIKRENNSNVKNWNNEKFR